MLSTAISRRRGTALLGCIGLAAVLAACAGSAATSGPAGVPAAAPAATAAPAGFGGDTSGNGSSTGGAGDGANGTPANLYAPGQDLLIIKTGTLVLQVTDIDAGLANATHQVDALGGYVSGSDRSGDGDTAQASVTFRIPAARWDEALTGLRGIATRVLGEQSKTADVTGQVVDLGARIKNLQATEQALQAIMNRATAIKDVLAVQDQLTTVRGQIEEMQAQQSGLQEQAAYSTLTVTFSLKPDPVLTSQQQFDAKSQVDQASASLVGVLQALATAGIWFAIVWLPILLGIGIIAWIGFVIARRIRRVTTPAAPAAPAEPAS
ncbi:MAG TPA: DUF4349 domain-containing protein [Candidatus Dormibacteraeota bacterium]|nr:DUF4349 domain-containing protein [Candidatus Dormibacteraeota bacterium]